MIVVSDTSPITALLTVGAADVLPTLFGEVIIPEAVCDEPLRTHSTLPAWMRVEPVKDRLEALRFAEEVDLGEAEAIEPAKELHADRLLVDERKGRRLALREGLSVIGLLGIVLLARRRKLIPSARVLLDRLEQEAGMYLSEGLKDEALKTVGE